MVNDRLGITAINVNEAASQLRCRLDTFLANHQLLPSRWFLPVLYDGRK